MSKDADDAHFFEVNLVNIRPIQSEADFPGILGVINAFEAVPITVDRVREWVQTTTPQRICRRMVAVNPQDEVIGYSVAIHEAYYPDGQFYVWVGLDRSWQGQGGGALLYADAASFLRAHHATNLRSEVRDDSPLSFQFAERRGFRIEHHLFESTLDLLAFDERRYYPLLADLEAQGIRFCALADFGDSSEARRKLYDVNRATSLDDPASSGTFMPFEDFERWICGAEWYRPEGQLIAAEGDQWVGLAAVHLLPEKHEAYNEMTGVLRSHRGRKIAQGLKLCAIRYARRQGARIMRTNNDSLNAPMLAINRKLGYQPQPGKYYLRCQTFS